MILGQRVVLLSFSTGNVSVRLLLPRLLSGVTTGASAPYAGPESHLNGRIPRPSVLLFSQNAEIKPGEHG
jgi:hypothetical protein